LPTATRGGDGGNGSSNGITGSAIYYAGGGAGGTNSGNNVGTPGLGGGGSAGGEYGGGSAGTVNTGGGGGAGGAGFSGWAGGSGLVIIRTTNTAVSTTGSPTITTDAGYNVYKFTASGTITF
jgi:hypothetical protein